MDKHSTNLNLEKIKIPEQEENEEEDYWVVIKQLGEKYRNQQVKKKNKKKILFWGLIAAGIIVFILLLLWVVTNISGKQGLSNKLRQHPKKSQNISIDVSLKDESLISQNKDQHVNETGLQQLEKQAKDQISDELGQVLHISPGGSQVHAWGKVSQKQDVDSTDHLPFKQHSNHQKLLFPYSTMGMKQPNTSFDFSNVAEGFFYDYESKIYDFLKPFNETDCVLERLGDPNDGGYPLCTNLLNQTEALINLGVEGRDNFGCDLTTRKHMPNYQYDCTNSIQPACSTNSNSNVFSPTCLGEKSEQTKIYKYSSLKDIIDSRNLTQKHVIVKMDIEGAEWPGMRAFPREYLKYVDQIVMQIHNTGRNIFHQPYWGNLNIIEALKENFVPVYLHMNPGACLDQFSMQPRKRRIPAFAIEVTLVNKEIITARSVSRAYRYKGRQQLYGITFCDSQD